MILKDFYGFIYIFAFLLQTLYRCTTLSTKFSNFGKIRISTFQQSRIQVNSYLLYISGKRSTQFAHYSYIESNICWNVYIYMQVETFALTSDLGQLELQENCA
ncbi:Hypothetical_protein [Hexamita inflata]|uniref:Hypothetical_protein n=1 Tax=Hexamita inflata TaxID=28002 RepID=A0ABP1JFM0_9EUKA